MKYWKQEAIALLVISLLLITLALQGCGAMYGLGGDIRSIAKPYAERQNSYLNE